MTLELIIDEILGTPFLASELDAIAAAIEERRARPVRRCDECGVTHSNGDAHVCADYDIGFPCRQCGAATVFVLVAAPGTGQGRSCRNGHFDGHARELTVGDVR